MDAMNVPRDVLAVACGGAVGSVARYAVALGLARWLPAVTFPYAILLVNVVGCLAIGVLGEGLRYWAPHTTWLRPLLMTGLLGGLTTFSTFGYDTYHQLHAAQYAQAVFNVAANLVLGIGAVSLGVMIVRYWAA